MTDVVVQPKPIPSVRLSKSDSEYLAKSILRFRYNQDSQEVKDLIAERKALVNDIIKSVINDEMQAKIDAIQYNWLPRIDAIRVSFTGGGKYYNNYENLDINGLDVLSYDIKSLLGIQYGRSEDIEIRVPYAYYSGAFATFDARHPISSRWTDHERKVKKFKDEVSSLYKKALATIKTVTTTKRLVEIWPEVEPFVRARYGDGESKVKLPAVIIPTAELNNAFGLPILEDAA